MPRGFGMGRGYRGYGYWGRQGYRFWPANAEYDPDQKGTVYIGPCRCGFGPHAYYRTRDGSVVHASGLGYAAPAQTEVPSTSPEVENLRAENERLLERVAELEKKLEKR